MLLLGHGRIPMWLAVVAPMIVGLVAGSIELDVAGDAVRALDSSLAFLLVAVPIAILLGKIGLFDAAAERITLGDKVVPALWVLAAIVTTVLNLDASIVLLTPLYIRVARRQGLDPVLLALIPMLQSSLASSALPVSNLTNLIVADRLDVGAAEFVWRLVPASLIATTVGWFAYRRLLPPRQPPQSPGDQPCEVANWPQAWNVGVPAVAALLVGFVGGEQFGVEPWTVALVVAVALAAITRTLPWRALPIEAAVVAAGLAVLAAVAAPEVGLDRLLAGDGPLAAARASLVGLLAANAVNNLPALLVALPLIETNVVWAYLAAVNLGPVLWASGSLAGLLWLDIMRREGLHVSLWQYARYGARVGIPALMAAAPWVIWVASR
jgi:arsenical pump membrane protein